MHFPLLDKELGFTLFLKPEMFHPVRAFKIRGAFNFILKNSAQIKSGGLITHSSGNHGQALAYAGKILGYQAQIVVPENAPKIKVEAMKRWGAEIIFCQSTIEAREKTCSEIQQKNASLFVPPYDHPDIIEGQSTAVYEELMEASFDRIICPLGGGGLLAGSCLAAKEIDPNILIYGAEPEAAADGFNGLKRGERIATHSPNTIADGLRTTVGIHNFPVLKEYCSSIWLCSEKDIFSWGKRMLTEFNLLIEPSSATVLACLANQKEQLKGKRVMAVLSGGNVNPAYYLDNPNPVK